MACRTALMANGLPEVRNPSPSVPNTVLILPLLGAADNATHKIYIWDIVNDGQFANALDGGREPLVHLHVCLGS